VIAKINVALRRFLLPIAKRIVFGKEGNGGLTKEDLLRNFFQNLKKLGFDPKHIVDVGANHGTWTRFALTHFPSANYTLLEPQANLKKSVEDLLDCNPNIRWFNLGAGSKDEKLKFTISNRDDSSTFALSEAEARSLGFSQIVVPVVTLNNFIPTLKLPNPDIIKIDAEGLDLEVLQGATQFLDKCEVVLVEAGVVNHNFENSLLKVVMFMDEKGYSLFEITDLNRPFKNQVLWLVELAFVKKNGIFLNQPLGV
jgi:FkbM family methyltransferase